MATTPNYGFIMPDPTDFVTDLPADFEIFGDAVDARIKALNPETTLGDMSYRSSTADTKTRLPIGTTNQVLIVSGGVPTWGAAPSSPQSFSLLNSGNTTLPSASTFNVTGLTSFNNYYIFLQNVSHSNSNGIVVLRINGSTASNYNSFGFDLENITPTASNLQPVNPADDSTQIVVGQLAGTNGISGSVEIRGGNSTGNKLYNASSGGSGSAGHSRTIAGYWNNTALITSITLATNTGNSFTGGSMFIFGGN